MRLILPCWSSASSPLLAFSWLRHSLSSSSLGAIFLVGGIFRRVFFPPLARLLYQRDIWWLVGHMCWWLGLCSSHLANSSEPALLVVGTWLWLTSLQPLHGCHFPVGCQGIYGWMSTMVPSGSLTSSVEIILLFISYGCIYLVQMKSLCPCCIS